MNRAFRDVAEFHKAAGQPLNKTYDPNHLDRYGYERWKLLHEEVDEYLDAYLRNDAVEMADAIADIIYIAIGNAHCFGFDLPKIWDRVHKNNMTKKWPDGKMRVTDGKVIKPKSYKELDIKDIVLGNR